MSRYKTALFITTILALSLLAGFNRSIGFALIGLGAGLLIYNYFGMVGVLVLLAGFSWYPISAGPLTRIPLFFESGALVKGFVIALGLALLGMQFFIGHMKSSLFVPFIVLVISTFGWLFTLLEAPYSQTAASFSGLVYLMCVTILCAQYIKMPQQAVWVCLAAVLSFTLSTLIIYIGFYVYQFPYFFIPKDQFEAFLAQPERLQGGYRFPGAVDVRTWSPRLSGMISSVIISPFVVFLSKRSRFAFRIFSLMVLLFLGVAMLRTGGRGGWFAFLGGLAVVGVVGARYKLIRGFSIATRVALIAAFLFLYAATYLPTDNIFMERVRSIQTMSSDVSFMTRIEFWQRNLEIFQTHSMGIGFETLRLHYGFFEHNSWLILLNGIGPFGLLAYLAFWVWVAFRCIHIIRRSKGVGQLIGLAALGSLTSAFLAGFVENSPFLTESFWFIWGSAVALSYRVPVLVTAKIVVESQHPNLETSRVIS